MLPQRLDTVVATDMVATEDMVAMEAMAEDTMVKDPLTLMLSQDTFPEDMDMEDMVAMEAMVVMDTMERERLKPSQDMVDMVTVDMVVDMADTDAATTVRGRLKPNQDTSPEVMDMVVDMVMAVDGY